MGKDIPLGRIAGIKVGMNPTVLAVAALYTWALAHNFPIILHNARRPGFSQTAYWVAGGTGAFLLFVSLLVHELGHALVARDEGLGVHSMGLTILGGVTRMETSPQSAGAELRVSVVGPLASAACGMALLSAAYVTPDTGIAGLAGLVLAAIGQLNLLLAALNLVPATPLDGGRVLSSLIWLRSGSQAVAVKATACVGVAVGSGAVVYGLLRVRDHHPLPVGIWALVFGAFVLLASIRELQSAPLFELLKGVTVGDAMTPSPPSTASWVTVAQFLRSNVPDPDQQAWPVTGTDGRVMALLTADAIRAVDPSRWETMPVEVLALPLDRIVVMHPTDDLLPALQRVETSPGRRGLVVDPLGTVVGTIDQSALHRTIGRAREGYATQSS